MSLKITKASEPIKVETLTTVIYAAPGVGKTSLAFTAKNPILLAFDEGVYRAIGRKDTVRVKSWQDVAKITADNLEGYDTVIVDTVGTALDFLSEQIKKTVGTNKTGALTQQGWGALKNQFIDWLKILRRSGLDVVLVVHLEEQGFGEEVRERLQVAGGSKNEIYNTADLMGRIHMNREDQRTLNFNPTENGFGKNPAQFPILNIPDGSSVDFDGFLGRVIDDAKAKLNAMTEEQQAVFEEQQWFAQTLPKIDSPEGINGLIERAKNADVLTQRALNDRAKELGLTFNKDSGEYELPDSLEDNQPQEGVKNDTPSGEAA